MAKAAIQAQSGAAQGIEYTIYTYETGSDGKERWQKESVLNDMDKALRNAEQLIDKGPYRKVEVKQKYFDKKTNRVVDMTLKTYESNRKDYQGLVVVLCFLFAVLCGAGAFAAAYFLTQ